MRRFFPWAFLRLTSAKLVPRVGGYLACLLLCSLWFAPAAEAGPRVWLLIGDLMGNLEDTLNRDASFRANLSREFQYQLGRRMSHGRYELEVRGRATAADLWEALHSPETVGIIWVGHGRSQSGSNGGPELGDLLPDSAGMNVAPLLLSKLPPNLEFLGIVGCEGEKIFSHLREQPGISPNMKFVSFENSTFLGRGFQHVLSEATRHFNRFVTEAFWRRLPLYAECGEASASGAYLRVSRYIPTGGQAAPAALIRVQDRVLGVFPQMEPGQSLEQDVFLPAELLSDGLQVEIDASRAVGSYTLGEWAIHSADFAVAFVGVRRANGRLMGGSRHQLRLPEGARLPVGIHKICGSARPDGL